jgi:hypothetical protein
MTAKTDEAAPESIVLELRTAAGESWGTIVAPAKKFKTGSVGFYASGKVTNPKNGARYQVGANIILIGSKAAE